MITIRYGKDRGVEDYGWLVSRHTFSFGNYYDRKHLGFRALRVINDDYLAAGAGFPLHAHADMEILSYVLEGSLKHRDSMGNESVVQAGELQLMTAGTGVRHSEYNPSRREHTRFLQIWITPDRQALAPGYQQQQAPQRQGDADLQSLANRTGKNGAFLINQNVDIRLGRFASGSTKTLILEPERYAWLHVIDGALSVNGHALEAGDGAAITAEKSLELQAGLETRFLLFDLA